MRKYKGFYYLENKIFHNWFRRQERFNFCWPKVSFNSVHGAKLQENLIFTHQQTFIHVTTTYKVFRLPQNINLSTTFEVTMSMLLLAKSQQQTGQQ